MAAARTVKQYELITPGGFGKRHFEVQHNGHTILWIHRKTGFMKSPQINVQQGDQSILAACKLRAMSRNMRLFLGDPGLTNSDSWPVLDCEGFNGTRYRFSLNGRSFHWKQTHDSALGARLLGGGDFKLVDDTNDQVLAVWLNTRKMFKRNPVATLNYFVELDREMEVLSLAAIAAIQEELRRRRAAAGSGAAAGGAAGGGGA